MREVASLSAAEGIDGLLFVTDEEDLLSPDGGNNPLLRGIDVLILVDENHFVFFPNGGKHLRLFQKAKSVMFEVVVVELEPLLFAGGIDIVELLHVGIQRADDLARFQIARKLRFVIEQPEIQNFFLDKFEHLVFQVVDLVAESLLLLGDPLALPTLGGLIRQRRLREGKDIRFLLHEAERLVDGVVHLDTVGWRLKHSSRKLVERGAVFRHLVLPREKQGITSLLKTLFGVISPLLQTFAIGAVAPQFIVHFGDGVPNSLYAVAGTEHL